MAEEFEGRDLSEAVFWGVELRRATFRDVDLSDATFFHGQFTNVKMDGVVDGLVVNGVDVTEFVNLHDRWYPLRARLSPSTVEEMRETWAKLGEEWNSFLSRVAGLDRSLVTQSVKGEWCLRDTLRHLLFAMDKWFSWPILGERAFSPIGLPNTGSRDFGWPGIDLSFAPEFEVVLTERTARCDRFSAHLESLDLGTLPDTVDVLENGEVPAVMCYHVVFEEEFEHLRYAMRDIEVLVAT